MFTSLSPIITLINMNLIIYLRQYKELLNDSNPEKIKELEGKISRMFMLFWIALILTTLTIYINNKFLTTILFTFIFLLKAFTFYLIICDINHVDKIIRNVARVSLILFLVKLAILYQNISEKQNS